MARDSMKSVFNLLNIQSSGMPTEKAFLADLKKTIELVADESARKPSRSYKPSSMNCLRNMYFQIIGEEPDKNSAAYTLVGIANAGTDIHTRTQAYVSAMREHGFDCDYVDVAQFVKERGIDYLEVRGQSGAETKLYHKELNMSFMCDGIIKYRGKYYILEIKSEMGTKWNHRTDVDQKHYNQAIAYSVSLKVDGVLFVYISRDILDMKAYMFEPDDTMKQDLLGKIDECNSYVSKQALPPIDPLLPKSYCTYCGYRSKCGR